MGKFLRRKLERRMKKNVDIVTHQDIFVDQRFQRYLGIQDEERKIHLNALTNTNYKVLSELIKLFGVEEDLALTIALSVADWTDQDDQIAHETYGAENDYYESLEKPYKCKNRPFDSKEELMLVRGMTQQIYQNIAPYITLFGRMNRLQVNFDTAPPTVLKSLARSMSGPQTNSSLADADSLVAKLVAYRKGDDGVEMTEDDALIDINQAPVNAVERNIFLALNLYRTKKSDYINMQVKGVEGRRKISSSVQAIVRRADLAIVYWRRN